MKKVVKTGKKGDDDKRENGLKEYLKCEFIRINANGDDSNMFIYIYFEIGFTIMLISQLKN